MNLGIGNIALEGVGSDLRCKFTKSAAKFVYLSLEYAAVRDWLFEQSK